MMALFTCKLGLATLLLVVAMGAHIGATGNEDEPNQQVARWSLKQPKDFVANKIKNFLIYSGGFKQSYEKTLAKIEQRFEEEKLRAQPGDDGDLEVLHFKIATEEIRGLRANLEASKKQVDVVEGLASVDPRLVNECCQHHLDEDPEAGALACNRCQIVGVGKELLKQKELDEGEEIELLDQLEDLETNNNLSGNDEVEMGLKMDEATSAQLKKRTKILVEELFYNELKQLAIALYLCRLADTPISPILGVLNINIHIKVLDYLMNCASDMLPMLMGQKVEIEDPPAHWTKRLFGGGFGGK